MASDRVRVSWGFYVGLCFTLLIFPIRLTLSWLAAALVHELGHIALLKITHTPITNIQIGAFGIEMETGPMRCAQELLCALAGPAAGFLALTVVRWLPVFSICAVCQSVFNLIPIYPLDGGRVLRCMWECLKLPEKGLVIIEYCISICFGLFVIYTSFRFQFKLTALIGAIILLLKVKFSCKQRFQAVQ